MAAVPLPPPPPAVADANANASLNDAYQGGHVNPFNRAGRSSKRRKTAETLFHGNRITEQELGQQEVFHLQQVTSGLPAGAAIPGAPAWFGPAMAAALGPMQNSINNIEARQANATVVTQADALQPIRDAAGNVSPLFPATLRALNMLTNAQRSQLLQFYGRPANPLSTRDHRLKHLLGIRP